MTGLAQRDPPRVERFALARLAAVLVEHGRPRCRVQAKDVGTRRRRGIRTLASSSRRKRLVGGEHGISLHSSLEIGQRARNREQSVHPDVAGEKRLTHRRKSRGQLLASDDRGVTIDRAGRTLQPRRRLRADAGGALHKFAHVVAPEAGRQPRLAVAGLGPTLHLACSLDEQRLDAAKEPTAQREDFHHIGVADRLEATANEPAHNLVDLLGQRRQIGDIEVVHAPILARATDIPGTSKTQIRAELPTLFKLD